MQRQDLRQGLTETFGYDNLHRLTSVSGPAPMTQTYDARGNLTYRSGTVDAGNSHTISWTSGNLPATIAGPSGYASQFFYAPDRSRYKQQASYGGTSETALYIGGLMEKVTLGATTSWKHYIGGATGPVAVYTRKSSGVNEIHYLTQDHLGSVSAVTDAAGAVEVRLSYGAYGQRRNATAGSGNPSSGEWSGITNTTRRGYTFHEMLDNLDLIHMNGRVYDPRVGRFLSADPYVDGVLDTQGWNRYAYVHNNPLSYLDPSGYGQQGAETYPCPDNLHLTCGGGKSSGGGIIADVIAAATRIRDRDLSDRWRWVFGSEPSPSQQPSSSLDDRGSSAVGGEQTKQDPAFGEKYEECLDEYYSDSLPLADGNSLIPSADFWGAFAIGTGLAAEALKETQYVSNRQKYQAMARESYSPKAWDSASRQLSQLKALKGVDVASRVVGVFATSFAAAARVNCATRAY